MVQTLSYSQWKDKHKQSPKYSNLSKSEWRARYDSYLASVSAGRAPLAQYLPKSASGKKNPPSRQTGPTGSRGRSQASSLSSSLGFKLNPKTHDYLTARTNPFCPRIRDVGYPVPVVGGSLKWRAFARATLQTNANGYGWLLLTPGVTGWPDLSGISYSLAGNTQATDSIPGSFAPAPGVQSQVTGMTGGPMTSAAAQSLGPNSFVRLLALGARIRCDAPLLNKAGSIKTFSLPLMDQDAFTLTGNQLLTTFPNYTQWYQANIADSPWFSTVFSPSFPLIQNTVGLIGQDTWQMEGGVMQIGSIVGLADQVSCTMGIIISGAPNQTFDFEVVGWYEMFGQIVLGNSYATPTYADPIGQSIVQGVTQTQSLNTMTKTATGAVDASNVLSAVGDSIKTVLGKIDPASVLSSMFGGKSGSAASTVTPTPEVGPELSGYSADAESLATRLAALKMPSVPGSVSSTSELSDAIPVAMEALAL